MSQRSPTPPQAEDEASETVVDARGSAAASAALERFEVKKELGRGGMAVVYRARDSETGAEVALKILTGNLDAAARVRFSREVRAASRLSHDNICGVVAVGESDGRPFLAMELVRGETLADLAKRGPDLVPARVTASLLAQLLDALAHAHAAGVLHRDLKPANMMVTPEGVLKLLDFGIAKSIDDETVTKTGALVGTPAYMAPEQVKLEAVDHRVDLFSAGLAVTAFLKKNRHRFHGRKLDPTQMLIRVALEPTAPLLEDVPAAPVALDNIIAGLTALHPARRFADAAAARAALEESGLLPPDGKALVARYIKDPGAVAAEENAALAQQEAQLAHALAGRDGGTFACALALQRAALLAPDGPFPQQLAAYASQHKLSLLSLDEERARDDKVDRLARDIQGDPQSPVLLKRMSDVLKAKANARLSAAYLWRYLRERPDDALALMQLRTALDGPIAADSDEAAQQSSARLSTRSIVAGIRTGGLKALPITGPAQQRPLTQKKSGAAQLLRDEPERELERAPRAPVAQVRGPATVVVTGGAHADDGRGRTVLGAAVAAVVLLAVLVLAASLWGVSLFGGGSGHDDASTDKAAILVQAEAALASDAARAAELATTVLQGGGAGRSATPTEGREALWIRARAHHALGRTDAARADCDLYLARATDFHDPHLLAVKELLGTLGARAE